MKTSSEGRSTRWGRSFQEWKWWKTSLRVNRQAIVLYSKLKWHLLRESTFNIVVRQCLKLKTVCLSFRFPDDFSALTAMHKLNNKMVPSSQPPVKFRLNHTSLGGKQAMEKDYSLWIGDLSPDVDDYTLYKGFASRYPSVRLAKGIKDS